MIVAFGDSITAGQHATRSYADILGYHNAGVPGDTTKQAIARFPKVAALEPKVVVIQFGHNDANVWETNGGYPRVPLEEFKSNLIVLAWSFRKVGAKPFIVGLHRPMRDYLYERRCEDYNAASREAAAESCTPWIEMWDLIRPRDMLDGLHLNQAGHERYAERIGWFTQPRSSTTTLNSAKELWSDPSAFSEVAAA